MPQFCLFKRLRTSSNNGDTNDGEAGETAIKIARKWGYKVKNIPPNLAKVIFVESNYWGSSIAALSSSTDPTNYNEFGPYVPGFETVPFNDTEALFEKLRDRHVCAFMLEPILGEAGVIMPRDDYLREIREACTEFQVLMIADETQCGLGRAGSLSVCQQYNVQPDILLLGKGLSGGVLPVSAVLADRELMEVLEPNTHRTTFGGSPIASKIAKTALQVLLDEKLTENSMEMGELLRKELCGLPKEVVAEVRGAGLFNCMVLSPGICAWDVCLKFLEKGLLAKPTMSQVIGLSPPLTIKEKDLLKATDIIKKTIHQIATEDLARKEDEHQLPGEEAALKDMGQKETEEAKREEDEQKDDDYVYQKVKYKVPRRKQPEAALANASRTNEPTFFKYAKRRVKRRMARNSGSDDSCK